MDSVRGIYLKNSGMFSCRLDIIWYDWDSKEIRVKCSGNLPLSHDIIIYPEKFKIPSGCTIRAYADVKAGKDKKGKEAFVFDENGSGIAKYIINGTTTSNELYFAGII